MKQSIKWEMKKAYHEWGKLVIGLIGLVLVLFLIPNRVGYINHTVARMVFVAISMCLGVGVIMFMFFPLNNMMHDLKEANYAIERLRGSFSYERLTAKLCVNVVSIVFAIFLGKFGTAAMERFRGVSDSYFIFALIHSTPLTVIENAVFSPLVFLFIYYFLGRNKKMSHGVISFLFSGLLYITVLQISPNIWIVAGIELILSAGIFYLLGIWLPEVKEPFQ